MRRSFTSHATFFTFEVFGLPRRSQLSRYVITLLTFMLLTLMHVFTCPGMELCVTPAQLAIHVGAAGAIIFEDVMIGLFKKKSKGEVTKKAGADKSAQAAATGDGSSSTGMRKRRTIAAQMKLQPRSSQPVKEIEIPPSRPLRLLGFCWVATFWLWSVSNLMYSLCRC